MHWLVPACVTVAVASTLATGALQTPLRRRDILDRPNERSSHEAPTPRGGGLAVVPIVLAAWLIAAGAAGAAPPAILAATVIAAAGLALLSWIDDLRSLPAGLRLAAHAVAVGVAMIWLREEGLVFQGLLAPWLDAFAAAIGWIWFINLFNFMDGIDGLSGVEGMTIGSGLALLAAVAPAAAPPAWLGASLAAALAGFLLWNWHPARIFLGDVGSVPLGFLFGFLLLVLAARGLWAPALILPLYYLADATITLTRRAAVGKPFWRPHREHFYQRAAQGGLSHAQVSLATLSGNIVLVGLALVAVSAPLAALGAAALVVILLLIWMRP